MEAPQGALEPLTSRANEPSSMLDRRESKGVRDELVVAPCLRVSLARRDELTAAQSVDMQSFALAPCERGVCELDHTCHLAWLTLDKRLFCAANVAIGQQRDVDRPAPWPSNISLQAAARLPLTEPPQPYPEGARRPRVIALDSATS